MSWDGSLHEVPSARGPLMTATELAGAVGVGISTIVSLERDGLLLGSPHLQSEGVVRLFDSRDQGWVEMVLILRATGMSTPDLAEALRRSRRTGLPDALDEAVERHRAAVTAELVRLIRALGLLDDRIVAVGLPSSRVRARRQARGRLSGAVRGAGSW